MADVVQFACPGCGRRCELNIANKSLRHQVPTCPVYERTKGNGQEFLKLAKLTSLPKDGKIERIN